MEAKFTKGEWEVSKCGREVYVHRDAKWMPHTLIATTAEIFMDRHERNCNAKLIAAAPKMYALLEAMTKCDAFASKADKQKAIDLLNKINS